jgi:iron-sulfur cluster assembly accessory protein
MPSIQLTEGLLALTYWSGPIATHGSTREHVTVSERAARRIGEILRREAPGAGLRVSVEGGGCSGFQYKFEIDRERAADDITVVRDGATVLIDQVSIGYLKGSEIDFVDDLIGASFRVINPQATASCGCGTSFSI